MNTVQSAINHIRKKKLSYWLVKTTSGKLKGEYEGDDLEESLQEFQDLSDHLITGKYELTLRSSKQNYRGATVFDFEVWNDGSRNNAPTNTPNTTTTMDAQLVSIIIDIKTTLNTILMRLDAQDKEQERKFKDLAKALSDVFDDKQDAKPISPMDMIQGVKGLSNNFKDLKID